MKILILPRYDSTQAATRVRVLQYLPFLEAAGVDYEVFPVLLSKGISGKSSFLQFIFARIKSYFKVARKLLSERGEKSIFHIHSELFPFIPFAIEYSFLYILGKEKFIIELDDAWFHRYDDNRNPIVRILLGKKIDLLMKHSVLVIAGNQYIADRAESAGALKIEIIPTVVDITKYQGKNLTTNRRINHSEKLENLANKELYLKRNIPVVGWIGTPATTKFLYQISGVIRYIVENGIASFIAIGADPNQLAGLPVKIINWNEDTEVESLMKFDIGIMPLSDSKFERGKCGYKIIQYMACRLPVIASPVGVNSQIVIPNETGFLASADDEWTKYISKLCSDSELRDMLGQNGFLRADAYYSLRTTAQKYTGLLKSLATE